MAHQQLHIIHKHKHEHSLYRPKPFFRLFSFEKMASTQYYYQFLQLQLSPQVYHSLKELVVVRPVRRRGQSILFTTH
jgi:hypothetical protein